MLKDSLDQLIRDVIANEYKETGTDVPLSNLMEEVRRNTNAEDADILHWIKLLSDKRLIRMSRPNAYAPTDLDRRARELGVFLLIDSIDEDEDAEMELSSEDK